MYNGLPTEIQGLQAIKSLRAIAGIATTDKEAKEQWDDLLYSEQEKLIEEYTKLKELIN